MAQYIPEFGDAVCQLLGETSIRDAAKKCGGRVSPTTIMTMRDGKVPGPEIIVELATGMGGDPNPLLEKGGFRYLRYVGELPASVRRGVSRGCAPRELALA